MSKRDTEVFIREFWDAKESHEEKTKKKINVSTAVIGEMLWKVSMKAPF